MAAVKEDDTPSQSKSYSVGFSSISTNMTVRNLKSFLQTLFEVYKLPSNEKWVLTLAKEAVLDENKSILVEEFLQEVLRLFEVCFVEAGTQKHSQNFEIALEQAFSEKRCSSFHECAIKHSWQKLLFGDTKSVCDCSQYSQTSGQLMQQVLQYFWSYNSDGFVSVEVESTKDPAACDESDLDNIQDHAGWVIKRARDTVTKGENKIPARESVTDSNMVYGDKTGALEIISTLGKDVKQANGKFRFIVHDHVVPFFLFLHNLVESLINDNTMVLQKGNILLDCLDKMSKDKQLREKWNQLTAKSDATSVIVLQRIVTFFIKSKQQIIREKGGLKPNKSSFAVRQQLRQVSHHKTASSSSECKKKEQVDQLRSGDFTNESISQFLHSLSAYTNKKQEELLGKLTGKELATILKSVGKPSFLGKKKIKQITMLLEFINNT